MNSDELIEQLRIAAQSEMWSPIEAYGAAHQLQEILDAYECNHNKFLFTDVMETEMRTDDNRSSKSIISQ